MRRYGKQTSCAVLILNIVLLALEVRKVQSVEQHASGGDENLHPRNSIEEDGITRHYVRFNKKNRNSRELTANAQEKRVIIRCKGEDPEEQLDCLRDIMSVSGHAVHITRYLETTPYFAIDLPDGDSQVQELLSKSNIDWVEEDLSNRYSFEYHGPMEGHRWERRHLQGERDGGRDQDRDSGRDERKDESDGRDEGNNEIEKEDGDKDKDAEKDKDDESIGKDGQELTYGVYQLRAPEVWEEFRDIVGEDLAQGAGARVCIIDTGLRSSHEDLLAGHSDGSNNMGKELNWVRSFRLLTFTLATFLVVAIVSVAPVIYVCRVFFLYLMLCISQFISTDDHFMKDEDLHGHGTHVAGTVGAADNGRGVVGVAPKAFVFVVRVYGGDGQFPTSALIDALEECKNNDVHVINMSFGGSLPSKAEEEEFWSLEKKGILLVAAAGNTGDDDEYAEISYPAGYDFVVSVAASKDNEGAAHFSAFNSQVNVIAAGVDVKSLGSRSDSDYSKKTGTSMACPHVTGVAALLFSIFPDAGPNDVREAIEMTARDDGACGHDPVYGNGHVDAMEAALFLRSRFDQNYTYEREAIDDKCIQTSVSIKAKAKVTWAIRDPYSRFMFRGPAGEKHAENNILLPPFESADDCYEFVVLDLSGDGIEKGEFSVKFNETIEIEENKYEGNFFSEPFGCGGKKKGSDTTKSTPFSDWIR